MTTTYNDGATHTVDGASSDILVEASGTILTVIAGAAIVGVSGLAPYTSDITPYAPDRFASRANGVTVMNPAALNVSGGGLTGGNGLGPGYPATAGGHGAVAQLASATISGGTFTGGDGYCGGGIAFCQSSSGDETLGAIAISGGTFIGGNCLDANPVRAVSGMALCLQGSGTISGGTFTPGTQSLGVAAPVLWFTAHPGTSLVISGGVWQGDWGLTSFTGTLRVLGTGLSYVSAGQLGPCAFGGRITGTLSDGNPIDVQIVVWNISSNRLVLNTPTEIRFGS